MKIIDLTEGPCCIAAMPQLLDPNFKRAVVLMLRCNEQGALGLVLNRPAPMTVYELCQSQEIPCSEYRTEPVFLGGPCEADSHLLVLHDGEVKVPSGEIEQLEIVPGVQLVTAREGLEALASDPRCRLRCFLGYSGWGPDQLSHEIEEGAWITLPAEPRFVFDEPVDKLWRSALHSVGLDPFELASPGDRGN